MASLCSRNKEKIVLIIPAFNEEQSIEGVLTTVPDFVSSVIVVDNASDDRTAEIARKCGANVLHEPLLGYGAACLRGIRNLPEDTTVVVFMDADASDDPQDMQKIIRPILTNKADFVLGSRILGDSERGALLPQARFGNFLASYLIRLFFGKAFTDLGPFRAIRYTTLMELDMQDRGFGWTVEMQIKAAIRKIRTIEVPVRYRKRIGKSKITGTLSGTVKAGSKILYLIFSIGIAKKILPRLLSKTLDHPYQ